MSHPASRAFLNPSLRTLLAEFDSSTRGAHSVHDNRFLKGKSHLLSEVQSLQVSNCRSGSFTNSASFNVSSPNKSVRHSKSEIPEKLGKPARLRSVIHSFENRASKRTLPSKSGAEFVLMVFLKSWCEGTSRAMFST